MKKIFQVLIIIGIIISIIGIIVAEDLFEKPIDVISTKLSDEGISGMRIVNISINDIQVIGLTKETTDYNLETVYTKEEESLTQDIYLTNKLVDDTEFKVSTLIEIDYPEIRWNGTIYYIKDYTKDKPLKLTSWYENSLIVPNIFFDEVFNKRINYKDVAKQGGYALVYSENDKYYVELLITKTITSLTTEKIDPIFTNETNGFSTLAIGSSLAYGICAINSTDLYIIDDTDNFIYHTSNTGTNISDGISTLALGSTNPFGLTCNRTDLWLTDNSDQNVYHTNLAGTNLTGGTHIADSVGTSATSLRGIRFNGTDFWISDDGLKFIWHLKYDWTNISDGFAVPTMIAPYGISSINVSDMLILAEDDDFVYHYTNYGVNITDGFSTGVYGSGSSTGVAYTIGNIYITDPTDDFVYHITCTGDWCVSPVPSQNITGRVVNSADSAVSGATIVILNATGGYVANTSSNESGYWYYSYTNGTLINYTIVGYNTNNISQGGKAYPFISQVFG